MKNNRRNFLKSTGGAAAAIASVAVWTGASAEEPAAGANAPMNRDGTMPHGMTLLSIAKADDETLGVKTSAGIVDVKAASRKFHMQVPLTLDQLLQSGGAGALEKLVAAAQKSPKGVMLDEGSIKYGRLFQNPGKIVCIGLNYREHAKEAGEKVPSVPILFNKYNNTLAPHQATIKLPTAVSTKFDYEVELLVVIGKRAVNVSEADARSYVAGYCTSNDFSARDLQLELDGHQWMIGKTLDHFAPIGPYFVSADLVPDPNALNIECRVNGETRQHSNTSQLIFNVDYLVSYVSRYFALEPGDLIFTGTPPGVIVGMPPEKQVWLKAGDQIACSVGALGELKFGLA
jgi:2-keto-4-pentenoate hydratase/2-oxohepta-3-ene-1,7-dioic acid hydratase in catechol pathway